MDVEIETTGPFRPGAAIAVTARATARRVARNADVELLVLDPGPQDSPGPVGQPVSLERLQRDLSGGSEDQLAATVTFAEPGYYRVLVRAKANPPTGAPAASAQDTVVRELDTALLWIVVDEAGGRLTHGYDASVVDANHLPLYGAYGPFRKRRVRFAPPLLEYPYGPGHASAFLSRARATGSFSANVLQGSVEYIDLSGGTQDTVPLAGGRVEGNCYGKSRPDVAWYDLNEPYTAGINGFGNFTIFCPTGYDYVDGNVKLIDRSSNVTGFSGPAGVYFEAFTWEQPQLRVGNDYAAHFFLNLEKYIPIAEQKFSPFSRSDMNATVSDIVTSGSETRYDWPASDRIFAQPGDVFNKRGQFVAAHEYGHAFHVKAIEPYASYFCSPPPGVHYIGVAYTPSCAFVEGFGDFFAAWVAGGDLTTSAGSDYKIEFGAYRANGDGLLIEGAVAGFFYDLVDDANDPNGSNNASTGSDDDTVSFPGSYIAQLIQTCQLDQVTALDGVDQFIYCAEDSLAAQSVAPQYSTQWRTSYTSVASSATKPNGWSLQVVRTLWLRNLYNQ